MPLLMQPQHAKYVVHTKEVCNRGVACWLLKLDGGWQATPSITKFLSTYILGFVGDGEIHLQGRRKVWKSGGASSNGWG